VEIGSVASMRPWMIGVFRRTNGDLESRIKSRSYYRDYRELLVDKKMFDVVFR